MREEKERHEKFTAILSRVMDGEVDEADYLYLKKHNDDIIAAGGLPEDTIRLCTTNDIKDDCNLNALVASAERAKTPIVRIEAAHSGPPQARLVKAPKVE